MTQDEKELLLKDLCSRLPYKLHCRVFKLNGEIKENDDVLYGVIGDNVITLKSDEDECLMYYQIKPYLRPMSSMTKAERAQLEFAQELDTRDAAEISISYVLEFFLENQIDNRGLIERGLGINCTGLNIYENEKST